MENRAEKRYLMTEDIMAWGHGKYSREELAKMNMPRLGEVHMAVYMDKISEIQAIRR